MSVPVNAFARFVQLPVYHESMTILAVLATKSLPCTTVVVNLTLAFAFCNETQR